jgi:predicted Holliday junction resolvase-like endonuclease
MQLRQAAQAEAGASVERWRVEAESTIRADAIRRSSAVVSGKVSEHLAPYMAGFPYNPKDARFLGTPIDFLVFDGMSDDDVREVVFLEIKTGGSSLTTRERRVRDAVLAGRVSWREFRVGGG